MLDISVMQSELPNALSLEKSIQGQQKKQKIGQPTMLQCAAAVGDRWHSMAHQATQSQQTKLILKGISQLRPSDLFSTTRTQHHGDQYSRPPGKPTAQDDCHFYHFLHPPSSGGWSANIVQKINSYGIMVGRLAYIGGNSSCCMDEDSDG